MRIGLFQGERLFDRLGGPNSSGSLMKSFEQSGGRSQDIEDHTGGPGEILTVELQKLGRAKENSDLRQGERGHLALSLTCPKA